MNEIQAIGEASYRVTHETLYRYAINAIDGWHLGHLRPRDTPWQRVEHYALEIDPQPSELDESEDFFGNRVVRFAVHRAHRALSVVSRATVRVAPRAVTLASASPPWEHARDAVTRGDAGERFALSQFVLASAHAPLDATAARFAELDFAPGRAFVDALLAFASRINFEFEFDPTATTTSTPIAAVIDARRGVCQDFAHLMVSSLRSVGIPTRYVSGFILNRPPEGQPLLTGADATHAWVSAWCPQLGWVDVDPTNAKLADTEFVTLAWGRDYADITPLRGVVLGGGTQALEVRVTVEPGE